MKKNFVPKWYDFVANLTWADVKQNYTPEIQAKYAHVNDGDKVDLERFRELRGKNVVLSAYCGVPAAKRAKLAKRSKAADARGVPNPAGSFTILNRLDKRQENLRAVKYPEMTKAITKYIMTGW